MKPIILLLCFSVSTCCFVSCVSCLHQVYINMLLPWFTAVLVMTLYYGISKLIWHSAVGDGLESLEQHTAEASGSNVSYVCP